MSLEMWNDYLVEEELDLLWFHSDIGTRTKGDGNEM